MALSKAVIILGLRLPPIGVIKIPGATVTTLIPNLPKSLAKGKVIPLIAPLEAAYTVYPFYPSDPATEDTFIITPLSPVSFKGSYFYIYKAAYLDTIKVPTTLIYNTFTKSEVLMVFPKIFKRYIIIKNYKIILRILYNV